MIQIGTKFSSENRNGYKHVYQVLGEQFSCYIIRNTSYPEVDARGKERWVSKETIETGFENGHYTTLN